MMLRGWRESWRADFCMFAEGKVSGIIYIHNRLRKQHTLCEPAAAGFRDLGSHARQIGSRRGSESHL